MKMAFQAGFKEKRNRMRGLFQALCRLVFLSQFSHEQPDVFGSRRRRRVFDAKIEVVPQPFPVFPVEGNRHSTQLQHFRKTLRNIGRNRFH